MKFLLPILAALALPSCTTPANQPSGLDVYNAYDRPASRPSDPSAVRVKVSTSRQRVYVMEGSKPLLVMPVSVGTSETPTPLGDFRILKKDRTKRSPGLGFVSSGDRIKKSTLAKRPAGWSFKGMPLPYWVELKPGFGFHTGWIKHIPCTDGSIRMHRNVAPKFYEIVSIGTPVNIAVSQPEDGKYGSIPLPPDAGPLPDYPHSYYLTEKPFTDHQAPVFE
ncbi:L,D-transpeptidase [Haloferula sp.]|uniref:L,D-transpeptidase n=1 Tax=Haloferula sp. TaxID=2497595 RepID=UPI003C7602EB